jgi:hypothetical protein
MKGKRFFAGIMAVILVFGLIVMGCPTGGAGDTDNDVKGGEENKMTKFEGTWKHTMAAANNATYTFSSKTLTYKRDDFTEVSGTFTFDDTTLSITFENGDIKVFTYTLTETTLKLAQVSGDGKYYLGTFEKQ